MLASTSRSRPLVVLTVVGSLGVALLASSIAASSLGCSSAPVEGSAEDQVRDRGGNAGQVAKNDNEGAAADAGSAKGASSSSSSSSSSGATPSTKGDAAAPPPAAPECLAQCESSGLKAKCAQPGEDDFCDFACEELTPQERTCLAATASCNKTEWVACVQQEEEEGGGGDGKK